VFDPLDVKTWREDPNDCMIPAHELDEDLYRLLYGPTPTEVAEADAEQGRQAKTFLGMHEDAIQREALKQLRRSVDEDAIARQVQKGLHEVLDAVKRTPENTEILDALMDLEQKTQELLDLLDSLEKGEKDDGVC